MQISSVNLRRSLGILAILGILAVMVGSSLMAAVPAIAAPGTAARTATPVTITMPMTRVAVTRLVAVASSPAGQAEVQLADGEVIAIPGADAAGVLARSAQDAAAPAVKGNCGTSEVKLKEKVDDHPVQMTTGFTVTVPAISYKWQVAITGPGKYSHTYNAGGGLMFRKTWNGSYNSPADEPQGDYEAKVVVSNSYALLDNMEICHSLGPAAKAFLTSPDTPVSWSLSTKGAAAPAAPLPTNATSGFSRAFRGTGKASAAVASSPETVIGKDTRKRVTDTTAYPYSTIALLVVTFPGRRTVLCTGFFYAANIVATAGHCLYTIGTGHATKVQVIPGNNATMEPYGSCAGTRAYSVTGWVNSRNGLYDYGAVKLNCNIGDTTGWLGMYWTSGSLSGTVAITGYPGVKPPARSMWYASGKIASAAQRQIYYPIPTSGGQSGSPVYRPGCGAYCAIAIHAQGVTPSRPKENAGTRITQVAFGNLLAWR